MIVRKLSESNSILLHFLSEIRDTKTQRDSMRFRRNMERVGEILAYEISKELNFAKKEITTPLSPFSTKEITDNIVLATVFRAGLPFHQGFLNYFDKAENAFVSAYRKYKDSLKFDIVIEYLAAPDLNDKIVILADPMLASGSSIEQTYNALLTKGKPKHVHIAAIISSQDGINYLKENINEENVTIWSADIDPNLNEHLYIIPGLGDAGDLAYGEKL